MLLTHLNISDMLFLCIFVAGFILKRCMIPADLSSLYWYQTPLGKERGGGGGGVTGVLPPPRWATLHQLTPDVWAHIGGKWVLFGHGGRQTVSPYMGIFLEGLLLYGCVFRGLTALGVYV